MCEGMFNVLHTMWRFALGFFTLHLLWIPFLMEWVLLDELTISIFC